MDRWVGMSNLTDNFHKNVMIFIKQIKKSIQMYVNTVSKTKNEAFRNDYNSALLHH